MSSLAKKRSASLAESRSAACSGVVSRISGGFSFWRRDRPSWPYISIHVANALSRAKAKGYAIPESMTSRSLDYLQNVERHIPSWYSKELRWTLIAYALHVRKAMGDLDANRAWNDCEYCGFAVCGCGSWLLHHHQLRILQNV